MMERELFNVLKRFIEGLDIVEYSCFVESVRLEGCGLVVYLRVYDEFMWVMRKGGINKCFEKVGVEECMKATRDLGGESCYEVPIYRVELGVGDFSELERY